MRASVCLAAAAALIPLATAHAQSPKPLAAPSAQAAAAPAAAAAGKSVTVVVSQPGTYQLFVPGQGVVTPFSATDKPSVTFSADADHPEADVIDQTAGTVAVVSTKGLKAGQTETVTPSDFKMVRSVSVPVTANGKPVATGAITLTDAAGHTQSHLLTTEDNGVARFENVALGKATVKAAASAGGAASTTETVVAPAKGGGAVSVPISLAGNVPTIEPAAGAPLQPPRANGTSVASVPVNGGSAAPSEPPANNWIPGVIGIGIMAAGIFYGVRALKNRGVTVEDTLKKIGVEMPQDGAGGTLAAPLKATAAPPPLPPLPSLNDLPAAGPASAGAAASTFGTAPSSAANAGGGTAVRTAPRLLGVAGAVDGESFPLENGAPFTVGRDEGNSLALTSDMGISRRHAHFEPAASGGWTVVDAGSSNGTYVNGQKLTGAHSLRAGDEIQIGGARFRYEA